MRNKMQGKRLKWEVRKYDMIRLCVWSVLLVVVSFQVYPVMEFGNSVREGIKAIQDYDMEQTVNKVLPLVSAEKMNFINTGYEVHNENESGESSKESTIYLGELQGKYILSVYPSDKVIDPAQLSGAGKVLRVQDKSSLIDYENILIGVIKDLNVIYKEQVDATDFIEKVVIFEEEDGLIRYKLIVLVIVSIWLLIGYQALRYLIHTVGIRRVKGRDYRVGTTWRETLSRIERDKPIKEGRHYKITENWFINLKDDIVILPIGLIIWVYEKKGKKYIHMKDGQIYVIKHLGKKVASKLYEDIKVALPWTYQDDKKALQESWKHQRMQMIEEAIERKLDYDLSEWL